MLQWLKLSRSLCQWHPASPVKLNLSLSLLQRKHHVLPNYFSHLMAPEDISTKPSTSGRFLIQEKILAPDVIATGLQ